MDEGITFQARAGEKRCMSIGVIVINLDRDQLRMAHMRRELERAGLAFERFPAVCGDCLPRDLAAFFDDDSNLSPGEIGCYASHLAIMQKIARGELSSPQLVLEDDVGLAPDFAEALDEMMARLPEGWDIVRLSYHTKLIARPVASLSRDRELVRYSRVPTTTGAYLISASGAQKFLQQRTRAAPVDHDLRDVWEWDLDTYGVNPPLVAHDILGASSIDALSPTGRARRQRVRRHAIRARISRGIRDFGLRRWLALGPLNLAARLTPKALRPSFVKWASGMLA